MVSLEQMFLKLGMHNIYLIYMCLLRYFTYLEKKTAHIIFSQEKKQLNQPTKPEGHICPQLLCFLLT